MTRVHLVLSFWQTGPIQMQLFQLANRVRRVMTCLSALLSNTPLVRHPASVSDVACLPLVGSSIFDEIQLEQIETIACRNRTPPAPVRPFRSRRANKEELTVKRPSSTDTREGWTSCRTSLDEMSKGHCVLCEAITTPPVAGHRRRVGKRSKNSRSSLTF